MSEERRWRVSQADWLVGSVVATFILLLLTWLFDLPQMSADIVAPDSIGAFWPSAVLAMALHLAIFVTFRSRPEHNMMQVFWTIRVGVIMVAAVYYEAHYRVLDAFGYYRQLISGADFTFNIGDSTTNVTAVMHYMSYLIGNTYGAHKVAFAFIGLLAVYAFYRGSCLLIGRASDLRNLAVFMLMPSLMFWSSIIGKDPLVLFCLGMYFYGSTRFLVLRRPNALILVAASFVPLMYLRAWLPYIFAIATGFMMMETVFKRRDLLLKVAVYAVAIVVGLIVIGDRFGTSSAADLVGVVRVFSDSFGQGGSGRSYSNMDGPGDLLWFVPWGMFSAVFRPLPGDVGNVFGLLAGFENAILIVVSVCALLYGKVRDRRLTAWVFVNLATWALFYAFVSPFNLATGFRFRIQALPFLLALIAIVLRSRQPVVEGPPREGDLLVDAADRPSLAVGMRNTGDR